MKLPDKLPYFPTELTSETDEHVDLTARLAPTRMLFLRIYRDLAQINATAALSNYSLSDLLFDITRPELSFAENSYSKTSGKSSIQMHELEVRSRPIESSEDYPTEVAKHRITTKGPAFVLTQYLNPGYSKLAAYTHNDDPDLPKIFEILGTAGTQGLPDQPERIGEYALALMHAATSSEL